VSLDAGKDACQPQASASRERSVYAIIPPKYCLKHTFGGPLPKKVFLAVDTALL